MDNAPSDLQLNFKKSFLHMKSQAQCIELDTSAFIQMSDLESICEVCTYVNKFLYSESDIMYLSNISD